MDLLVSGSTTIPATQSTQALSFGYTGLGALQYAQGATSGVSYEEFKTDALGNRLWVRDPDVIDNVDRTRYHSIDAATGQLTNSVLGTPTCGNGGAGMRSCHPTWYQYEYTQDHDLAGNVIASWGRDTRGSDAGSAFVVPTETRSFYDAADQLTYFNRHSGQTLPGEANGVFEEYRSDALGRRVLVRSRRPSSCASPCEAFVQRTVWDGAQVLYEIRSSGNTGATANAMELEGGAQAGEDPNLFGIVAYAHAEGLDHPVGVLKHYASSVGGSGVWGYVTPHANFQGAWSYGTLSNGATCISVGQNCPAWPGYAATVDGRPQGADVSSYVVWWGDVLRGPTTSGGPQYLRNRYYDASTGRFTQLDPIGLAGGMNLYGFAGGDPVNFADPIGLLPLKCCIQLRVVTDATSQYAQEQFDQMMGFALSTTPLGVVGAAERIGSSIAARVVQRLGRGKAPEFLRGILSEKGFLSAVGEYLGEGYAEVSPGRFLSKSGERQVRFGAHEVGGGQIHGHFETLVDGRVVENARVNIKPDRP